MASTYLFVLDSVSLTKDYAAKIIPYYQFYHEEAIKDRINKFLHKVLCQLYVVEQIKCYL